MTHREKQTKEKQQSDANNKRKENENSKKQYTYKQTDKHIKNNKKISFFPHRQTCAASCYASQYMANMCIVSGIVFDVAFSTNKNEQRQKEKSKRTNTTKHNKEQTRKNNKLRITKYTTIYETQQKHR